MFNIRGTDGKEYGPVSAEVLRQWIAEGRANAQTLCQAEGSADWKPLGTFAEFVAALAQGAPPHAAAILAAPIKISNYLVPAILSTICCCLPFGIVAIVFAAQVNAKVSAGDITGAQDSSRKARMWCWIAFGLGLPLQILVVVLQIFGVLAGRLHH